MGIMFRLQYHEDVVRDDISRLSATAKRTIRIAIEEKLTTHPEQFGKPLRRSLRGYRKLRVGDYRVVFRIEGNVVSIFGIMHRSIVYDREEHKLLKRQF